MPFAAWRVAFSMLIAAAVGSVFVVSSRDTRLDTDPETTASIPSPESADPDAIAKLAAIYGDLPPREAARVLEHLPMSVLTRVVPRMKPGRLDAIVTAMPAAAAARVRLARGIDR